MLKRKKADVRRIEFIALALFAYPLFPSAFAADYSSESACRRAEPAATCDRLFPHKPAPPPIPTSLDACTGMLEESTARAISAVVSARFDDFAEAARYSGEAGQLAKAAADCTFHVKSATTLQKQRFDRARQDNLAQAQILQAVMSAH